MDSIETLLISLLQAWGNNSKVHWLTSSALEFPLAQTLAVKGWLGVLSSLFYHPWNFCPVHASVICPVPLVHLAMLCSAQASAAEETRFCHVWNLKPRGFLRN